MTSVVRTATEQDLRQLAEHFDEQPGWLEWARATLRRRDAIILVAKQKGRAVAYCTMHTSQRGDHARQHGFKGLARHLLLPAGHRPDAILQPMSLGFIDALWVEPDLRRQGVAAALVANSARWLEAAGVSEVQVVLDYQDQLAQDVFRHLGFEPMQVLVRCTVSDPPEQAPSVRRARQADLPQLAELMRREVEHQQQLAGSFDLRPAVDWRQFVAAKLHSREIGLFVVEEDGELAGFVEARLASPVAGLSGRLLHAASRVTGSKMHSERGVIEDVYVRPAVRRHGIASALVESGTGWLHSLGVREVDASIWAGNEASLAFFDHLDFVPSKLAMRRSVAGMKARRPIFVPLVSLGT